METLRKKWNSSRGASILMALLFLLVCMMVGASVLMAAVSNAGKLKSNREEQQKYLTLSSALNLICDELTSATYSGDFESELKTVPAKTDTEGNVTSPGYSYTIYTQKPGKFKQKITSGPGESEFELNDVLPLLPELDRLFAETFPPGGNGSFQGDDVYVPLPEDKTASLAEHTLKLTVDTPGVEGLSEEEVTIRLKMRPSHSIGITATLGEPDEGYVYTMKAWLVSSGDKKPNMKQLEGGSLSWTVDWIAKG